MSSFAKSCEPRQENIGTLFRADDSAALVRHPGALQPALPGAPPAPAFRLDRPAGRPKDFEAIAELESLHDRR